jgi:hypothetical protein
MKRSPTACSTRSSCPITSIARCPSQEADPTSWPGQVLASPGQS